MLTQIRPTGDSTATAGRLTTTPLIATQTAPKPLKKVAPEQNRKRWNVPDEALIATVIPVASKEEKAKYKVVADLVKSRIYVVDKATNEPIDAYLTSPGTDKFPTQGERFKIAKVMPMAWWNPPASAWAKKSKPTPPGPENPMGVMKLNLGKYTQYIHGIPKHEEPQLGRHASHGCLRMSNGNIVNLYQNYVGAGTVVELNRDKAFSKAMDSKFAASGRTVHLISDGSENVAKVAGACGPNQ
ncbi:MAG: L,D-transpeptidase [Candidatus Sericytochromatia bacterium]|nr:L,D-transpeptidase [Candidatus Sericytochromatia bacterium]